jgi:hypothetical protein
MELQRPSGEVQNEVAAEQTVLRVFDDGKKTDCGPGIVLG